MLYNNMSNCFLEAWGLVPLNLRLVSLVSLVSLIISFLYKRGLCSCTQDNSSAVFAIDNNLIRLASVCIAAYPNACVEGVWN